MNGDKYLIDTNIAIYLFDGDDILSKLLQNQQIFLSIINEIELSSFHYRTEDDLLIFENFISSCTILNISEPVKLQAIFIRKNYKLKLPDCIIASTAISQHLPLITADKSFQKVPELDLILYEK